MSFKELETQDLESMLAAATPGPWGCRWDEGLLAIVGPDEEAIAFDADERDSNLIVAAPEAVAEVVRLRRALEQQLAYITEELETEGVETHDDIEGTWPSMQRYGELSEMLFKRDFLTRILEGDTDA